MSDTEILDYLDSLTGTYSSKVILRDSETGRGWRLHEGTWPGCTDKGVRHAVESYKAAKELIAIIRKKGEELSRREDFGPNGDATTPGFMR